MERQKVEGKSGRQKWKGKEWKGKAWKGKKCKEKKEIG
jgi:hypothetical protein